MACGCAVANNEREEYEPFPPNRPIWHIDYENIENQLRVLLTNNELRIKLAQAGRYYVEKMHDHVGVANRMLHLLYPIDELTYDYHPDFYYSGFNLPAGEVIDDDTLEQTAEIIQKWGLPDDVSLNELVQRKLVSKKLLEYAVPRWQKELAAPKHTINDFISTPATPQWVEERSQPITAHPKKDDLALRLADAISALNEGDKETANKILKAAVNKYPQRVEAWAAYASSYKI